MGNSEGHEAQVCLAGKTGVDWVALLHRGLQACWWLALWGDGLEAKFVLDVGLKLVTGVGMSEQDSTHLHPWPRGGDTALGCKLGCQGGVSSGLEGILHYPLT